MVSWASCFRCLKIFYLLSHKLQLNQTTFCSELLSKINKAGHYMVRTDFNWEYTVAVRKKSLV